MWLSSLVAPTVSEQKGKICRPAGEGFLRELDYTASKYSLLQLVCEIEILGF